MIRLLKVIKNFFSLAEQDERHSVTYGQELDSQARRILPLASFLLLIGPLWYIPVDIGLENNYITLIITLRIILSCLSALIFTSQFMIDFKYYGLILLSILSGAMVFLAAIVTAVADDQWVYFGGFLFILMVLLMLPLPKVVLWVILVTGDIIFLSIAVSHGLTFSNFIGRYHLQDLLSASIVLIIFIYIIDKIRFKSWTKSKAIELQNDKLHKELILAREVQSSILPEKNFTDDKISLHSLYVPTEDVGGDFFDYHFKKSDSLAVILSDVVGHGLASSLIASMVKIAFSTQKDFYNQPVKLMENMNSMFSGKDSFQMMTVSYLYVDLIKMTLAHVNAGHLPLIVYRKKEQKILRLKPRGRIISWMKNNEFSEEKISLFSGDRIFLYTDGIIECINKKGVLFGQNHLDDFIIKTADLQSTEMIEQLMITLKNWVNYNEKDLVNFEDDITLVVLDIP